IFACMALTLMICTSAAYADTEDYDVAGTWMIKGVGHVDKSFVRSSLELSGNMYIQTESSDILSQDMRMLTSYDIYLRIDASTLNIKVYDKHIENRIRVNVPVPTRIPTAEYPIELPDVTYDDITYSATLTGANSGTVTISGIIRDVDVIGDLELDSDCKIWRAGTPEPKIDEGKNSGCNSFFGIIAMILTLGVIKRVRY
ncbi:MAG: hypothetical protein IJG34_03060, partial [Synergistaceae bacterium]|nr:hypothetical protein [Synergistaceae bacterium]